MLNTGIVVGSEVALALYPILIKKVPTDILTQIFSRILTYSALAFALASKADIVGTWGSSGAILRSILLGTLTLIHIGSSYLTFQNLSAGAGMTLFYTYPILNLVGAIFFLGESFSLLQFALVALAFAGVALVGMGTKQEEKKQQDRFIGILAGLAAAVTETIMYFVVKGAKIPSPFFSVLELYPGAIVGFLLYLFTQKGSLDFRPEVWTPMVLFNTLVGFLGYALRFYAIPRVSTFVFSLLSFIGVVASFIWGYFFVDEIPNWATAAGALLIAGSAFSARYLS